MKVICTAAIAASMSLFMALPSKAATFFDINPEVVKFTTGSSEADLIAKDAAKVKISENTTIYIGTNQVSSINQDPIVISFTNGVRDWYQSYDSSGIDGRGVGLLWDSDSENLYAVFTADGGSPKAANTFSQATEGGWLSGYGAGGGAKASVLLKLNPDNGEPLAGTFVRARLSSGKTNTVVPTTLDFVNGQVVFLGESFYTPLDVNKQPFGNQASGTDSPFPYRVVLKNDLTEAVSAEAIGWGGVTQFSPLAAISGDSGDANNPDSADAGEVDDSDTEETVGSGGEVETPDDHQSSSEDDNSAEGEDSNSGGELVGDLDDGPETESVPEPGVLVGLWTVLLMGLWRWRSQPAEVTPTQSSN